MVFSSWIRNWKRSLERRWALYQTFRRKAVSRRSATRPRLEALEDRWLLSAYVVNSTADDGSAGTLRDAINQVNLGNYNEIDFNIGTSGSAQTINLASQLPALTASGVLINGLTQGGSGNTTQLITLNGSGAGSSSDGLLLGGSNCTVSGLIIENFTNGIEVDAADIVIGGTAAGAGNILSGNALDGVLIDTAFTHAVTGVLVQGNFIGTTAAGSAALANSIGIEVVGSNNTIGGTTSGARNIISGNSTDGVLIDSAASGVVVQGNYIGTDATGANAVGNGTNGIDAEGSGNTIGGTVTGALNVISGNTGDGVHIGSGVSGVAVQGNYIGTDLTGAKAIANSVGVDVFGSGNTIGGTVTAARNIISGNTDGMYLAISGVTVQGNYIGTDVNGTTAVANSIGIWIDGSNNTLGGTTSGALNVISGNSADGVLIDSNASGVAVQGNYIGTNTGGSAALADSTGIEVAGSNNTIGGTTSSALNVISGNSNNGVEIDNGASGVVVQGNYIGTDLSGAKSVANNIGVFVAGAGNTIGGATTGAANVISGNNDGVFISGASGVTVQGNYIGTDHTGATSVANATGVVVEGSNNTIGGTVTGARNIISGNSGIGVLINLSVSGVAVQGNYIGTDGTGANALANSIGVDDTGASNNTIGGSVSGARNIISGNSSYGIYIDGSSGVAVQGNYIGTDVNGAKGVANNYGVYVLGSNNTIGGTSSAVRNVISDDGTGVYIDSTASGVVVQGNYIGTDATGSNSVGIGSYGVDVEGSGNIIGGSVASAGNVISGSGFAGVYIGNGASGVAVQGNSIGTDATGNNGIGNNYGVYISGANNTVGGTSSAARNFISDNAIGVYLDTTASGVLVQGNYIGINAAGTLAVGSGLDGIDVEGSSNTIGGTVGGAGNVISGNSQNGVLIGSGASSVAVQGNFIGTDATGTKVIGNVVGISVTNSSNTIGGTATGAGNVISGNTSEGLQISASGVTVQGNFIGTDVNGTTAVANSIGILVSANKDTIGGSVAGARNVISGNSDDGVQIASGVSGVQLLGNYIGTDLTASKAVANSIGVEVAGSNNTIGGGAAVAAHNVISGNSHDGVLIDSTASGVVVQGNFIGTSASGTAALGNSIGVEVAGNNNTVGALYSVAPNQISGNSGDGVLIDSGASGNQVLGNYIGTNSAATAAIANKVGIEDGGSNNTIGGSVLGARNVISGNSGDGVLIDSTATAETMQGNYIGLNLGANTILANGGNGVEVKGTGNTIGGNSGSNYFTRNYIGGNGNDGVLFDSGATGNQVLGNFIGVDISGTNGVGNVLNGIEIASNSNTIGGTTRGVGNVISGNTNDGVLIDSTGASNLLQGNYVGTDYSGRTPVTNSGSGIEIQGTANTVGAGNILSANSKDGVRIDSGASSNQVLGSYIGINISQASLGNGGNGVNIAGNSNTVGGTASGARNIISGNADGVLLASGGSGNTVLGNYIGTNAAGTASLANGIGIEVAGNSNIIGGSVSSGSRNLISGNATDGVKIDSGASGNTVLGNNIGLNVYGNADLSNAVNGVEVAGSHNTVGASYGVAPNVISGNVNDGVLLDKGASGNQVLGNYIGTNPAGTASLGNGNVGIEDGGTRNTIGGSVLGARNIISGNTGDGVLNDYFALGEVMQGNYIGVNVGGNIALGNGGNGVEIQGAVNMIGGNSGSNVFVRNYISGNAKDGIFINSINASNGSNLVQGNFIGVGVSGTNGVGNLGNGIEISGTPNTIGGTSSGLTNVISGNGNDGILVHSTSVFVLIQGNYVGTDYTGTSAVGNSGNGIEIQGTDNTVGGTVSGARNIISGNSKNGVLVSAGFGNTISQNSIFANAGLGISLASGANNNIAAPTILTATLSGSTLTVTGTFTATTTNSYVLEFFANPSGDAEGKIYLGSKTVTPTATGTQAFTFSTTTTVTGTNPLITATLTDNARDTSEFSNGVTVT